MRHTSLLLGGFLSSLAFATYAQNHDDEQTRSVGLGAHEHGVASLNLVVDGTHLILELDSPAANILGFEHTPTSDEDLAVVNQARQHLAQADALFMISGDAACTLEKVETESPLFTAATVEDHEHDKTHDGDDHESHENHQDHGSHEDHADQGSAHSDIEARFHFACDNPDALQQIDVRLFEVFPSTEKLLLQAITPKGQQGGELTSAHSVIRL